MKKYILVTAALGLSISFSYAQTSTPAKPAKVVPATQTTPKTAEPKKLESAPARAGLKPADGTKTVKKKAPAKKVPANSVIKKEPKPVVK